MEGHNIPLHPPVMMSPTPLAQNFHTQPIGISSQELQSLLAKPAKELPVQVFYELGNKLQPLNNGIRTGDWVHLAELLGFSRQQIDHFEVRSHIQREPPGFLMLMEWRSHEDRSTLFILRDTLWTCGRHDCVTFLDRRVEEIMFMDLYLRVIDEENRLLPVRLLKVRTKCDSTVRESIQNFLCGDSDDSEYELVDTPFLSKAKQFKGKQITLRKKNRTRPCVSPKESQNYNILISSSENSPGEENPSDDQFGQIKDLPENLEACCVSDSEPEVNSPNACPNTIRKTVYITEDCVYCGKIRTISQRHISETSSAVKTGVHCPTCNCPFHSSPLATSEPLCNQIVDPRLRNPWQDSDHSSPLNMPSEQNLDLLERNPLNTSLQRSSHGDTELTIEKQLFRVSASETMFCNKPRAMSCTLLPQPNIPTQWWQGGLTKYENPPYIPMNSIKRQRSVSEPPEMLLADLDTKFDISLSTSTCKRRPKRRKIELVYQEICENMRNFPGWDPDESEQTIEQSMTRFCREDGHYVIWFMRSKHRVVVTVSHMGRLVHYAVFSERHGDDQDWHYFFTEHRFTDIRSLLRHHMTNGLESQLSQNGDNRKENGASKSLRESRREQTKLSHVTLKYPRRPQPMKK